MSSCSKWWPSAILDFKNSAIFYSPQATDGQNESSCQISWTSMESQLNYGDLTVFSQNGGHPPSCSFKDWNLQLCVRFRGSICASLCYISCWSVKPLLKYYDFSTFQNAGRLPSWICYVHVWTSNDECLTVTITVQNLVEIDAIVSIMCKCWYLTCLAWNSYSRPKWRFLTVFCR